MRTVIVLVLLLVGALAMPASAQSPTPTATPAPVPASRVGVRFVVDGQPVQVFLWTNFQRIEADGEVCNAPHSPAAGYYPGYETRWPIFHPSDTAPVGCYDAAPTLVSFTFNAAGTVFTVDVPWTGEEITLDFDVGFLDQAGVLPAPTPIPTPTPTPDVAALTPAMTPAALPETGGASTGTPLVSEVSEGHEWGYFTISGLGLADSAGGCGEVIVGVRATYVSSCSASEMLAIVPWGSSGAESLSVVVDGATSAPAELDVSAVTASGAPPVAPGAVRVHAESSAALYSAAAALGDVVQPFGSLGAVAIADWYTVTVPDGMEVARSQVYFQVNGVDYAGPVALPTPATPDDPLYPQQWSLAASNLPAAWNVSEGGGEVIAAIDLGFAAHADLGSHLLGGYDCSGSTNVGLPAHPVTHGTAVAGVAAALTGNALAVAGTAPDAVVLPLSHLRSDGSTCEAGDTEQALLPRAIAANASVVNMSYSYGTWPAEEACASIAAAHTAGLLMVAAADNYASTVPIAPAACSKAIAVAASAPDGSRASYSNYNGGNGAWVDIAAPGGLGQGLFCAPPAPSTALIVLDSNGGTKLSCGTSFSSPLVAGAAALLAARGYYNCEIRETLLATATPSGAWAGAGLLNAGAALNYPAPHAVANANGNYPDGTVFRADSTTQWFLLRGGAKWPIQTPQDLFNLGYGPEDVECVPQNVLSAVDTEPDEGVQFREYGSNDVYAFHCAEELTVSAPPRRVLVPPAEVETVLVIPSGALSQYTVGLSDGCFVKEESSTALYVVCGSAGGGGGGGGPAIGKWHVSHSYALTRLGLVGGASVLWNGALTSLPNVNLDTCFDGDGDGSSNLAERFNGTAPAGPCSPLGLWPYNLSDSMGANRLNMMDLALFIAPVRRLHSSPPGAGHTNPPAVYDPRYDVRPGLNGLPSWINTLDLAWITAVKPPMPPYNGTVRAFNGSPCQP